MKTSASTMPSSFTTLPPLMMTRCWELWFIARQTISNTRCNGWSAADQTVRQSRRQAVCHFDRHRARDPLLPVVTTSPSLSLSLSDRLTACNSSNGKEAECSRGSAHWQPIMMPIISGGVAMGSAAAASAAGDCGAGAAAPAAPASRPSTLTPTEDQHYLYMDGDALLCRHDASRGAAGKRYKGDKGESSSYGRVMLLLLLLLWRRRRRQREERGRAKAV